VIRTLFAVTLLLAASACGGARPPPEDEVTETWTTGDDEPLSDPHDAD
jgi:hypothetical protein